MDLKTSPTSEGTLDEEIGWVKARIGCADRESGCVDRESEFVEKRIKCAVEEAGEHDYQINSYCTNLVVKQRHYYTRQGPATAQQFFSTRFLYGR